MLNQDMCFTTFIKLEFTKFNVGFYEFFKLEFIEYYVLVLKFLQLFEHWFIGFDFIAGYACNFNGRRDGMCAQLSQRCHER